MKKNFNICSIFAIILIIFASCNKINDFNSSQNPMNELNDVFSSVSPSLLPTNNDETRTVQNPFTNQDLALIEKQRIENEAQLLKEKSATSFVDGSYTFSESVNVTKNYSNTVIFDNTYAKAEIVSGGITFTPTFHFDALISSGQLQNSQAYIQNTVTGNATYKVTFKYPVENTYSKNLTSWSQTAFTLVGGVVPVWVTFNIQIDGGCYINSKTASYSIQQGMTTTSTVKIGAQWKKVGGWTNISTYTTPSFSATSVSYTGTGNVTIQPYLNVFVSAKLYDVLGPRLLITPYLTLNMNVANRYIDRTANLRANVYFSLAGLGLPSIVYNQDVFNKSYSFSRINF